MADLFSIPLLLYVLGLILYDFACLHSILQSIVTVRHLIFPSYKNHFMSPFTEFSFSDFCSFFRMKYAALASGYTELQAGKLQVQDPPLIDRS